MMSTSHQSEMPVPDEYKEEVAQYRQLLIEKLAENDDKLDVALCGKRRYTCCSRIKAAIRRLTLS